MTRMLKTNVRVLRKQYLKQVRLLSRLPGSRSNESTDRADLMLASLKFYVRRTSFSGLAVGMHHAQSLA